MTQTGKRLGRGLESLIGSHNAVSRETAQVDDSMTSPSSLATKGSSDGPYVLVKRDQIKPNPLQPRGPIDSEEVKILSDSLKRHGILQPITVRRVGDGLEIIAGERRWQAAKLAGLVEVPVIIREANDEQMLELALIENLQREDLNAIDRARAYRQFCERFKLSVEEVALRLGEDRSTVTNYLRLLELPAMVQGLVASKKLGMAHARMILSEPNAALRGKLAELAVSRELSVRGIEEVIRQGKELVEGRGLPETRDSKLETRKAEKLRSAHLRDMEQKFERVLKTRVQIKEGRRKGSGKVVIEFFTLDDFDRVAELLGVVGE